MRAQRRSASTDLNLGRQRKKQTFNERRRRSLDTVGDQRQKVEHRDKIGATIRVGSTAIRAQRTWGVGSNTIQTRGEGCKSVREGGPRGSEGCHPHGLGEQPAEVHGGTAKRCKTLVKKDKGAAILKKSSTSETSLGGGGKKPAKEEVRGVKVNHLRAKTSSMRGVGQQG